ncbi:MAG: hypothetical protein ACRD6I_17880, partial [Candidatus Acidiferrales bacterium]
MRAAQEPAMRSLSIRQLEADMRIDGRLDEAVWTQIEPTSNFLQTDPIEGQPASERTEVRIFYDQHRL